MENLSARLGMIDGKPGGIITCPSCKKENTFLLSDDPTGSTFMCACGLEIRVPLNKDVALAQISKNAEEALKKGLKGMGVKTL